jgi:hypothetical protein
MFNGGSIYLFGFEKTVQNLILYGGGMTATALVIIIITALNKKMGWF